MGCCMSRGWCWGCPCGCTPEVPLQELDDVNDMSPKDPTDEAPDCRALDLHGRPLAVTVSELDEAVKRQGEELVAMKHTDEQQRTRLAENLKTQMLELRRAVASEFEDFANKYRAKQQQEEDERQCLLSRAEDEREATRKDIADHKHRTSIIEEQLQKLENIVRALEASTPEAAASKPPAAAAAAAAAAAVTQQPQGVARGWIVPAELYRDERIPGVLNELLALVDPGLPVDVLESSAISLKQNGRVLLPCIGASRIGSDLQAAMDKAKLCAVAPIVLIFHHLAAHNCKLYTATKNRLSDRSLVERCQDMIDVVFWKGDVYDCTANDKAVQQLKAIAAEI